MSGEIIDFETYRLTRRKPDRHVMRVVFNFDHEISFDDMAAMIDALRNAGRSDIADKIRDRAILVLP